MSAILKMKRVVILSVTNYFLCLKQTVTGVISGQWLHGEHFTAQLVQCLPPPHPPPRLKNRSEEGPRLDAAIHAPKVYWLKCISLVAITLSK